MIPQPTLPLLSLEDLAPFASPQTPAPGEAGGAPAQGGGSGPNMTPGPGETATTTGEGSTKTPSDGGSSFLVPALIMFAVFYFVLIRPEKKNRQKRESMLGALGKGDEVVTTSGMYATVVQVQDEIVTLQAADGVRLRFSRAAVQTVVDSKNPKGGDSDKVEKSELATADAK